MGREGGGTSLREVGEVKEGERGGWGRGGGGVGGRGGNNVWLTGSENQVKTCIEECSAPVALKRQAESTRGPHMMGGLSNMQGCPASDT